MAVSEHARGTSSTTAAAAHGRRGARRRRVGDLTASIMGGGGGAVNTAGGGFPVHVSFIAIRGRTVATAAGDPFSVLAKAWQLCSPTF